MAYENTHPKIVGGNPACGRATYTRFALPFAWSRKQLSIKGDDPVRFRRCVASDWMHPSGPDALNEVLHRDRDRWRYFTKETAELLYHRAAWFVLEGWGGASSPLELKGEQGAAYKVLLRPPVVILFEFEPDRDGGSGKDLLKQGVLIHEAYFPVSEYCPSYAAYLRFNEIFRFWRCPFDKYADVIAKEELESMRAAFDRSAPALSVPAAGEIPRDGLFSWRWADLLTAPFSDGSGDFVLGGPDPEGASSDSPDLNVVSDDRAFTMAFVSLDSRERLKQIVRPFQTGAAVPSESPTSGGYWVKLLNVDRVPPWEVETFGGATLFEHNWASRRTYRRWAEGEYPSLYGFCEHAMAALVDKADSGQGEPELGLHFGQLYADVAMLLLYTRATIFRFSSEIHRITAEFRYRKGGRDSEKEWRYAFLDLRRDFMLFENLYQFPLLSSQQQHIEMFNLQSKFFDIKDLYDEVRLEIESSDEVLDNQMAENRNSLAGHLNKIAFYGILFTLLVATLDNYTGAIQARDGIAGEPSWETMPGWLAIFIKGASWGPMVPGIFLILVLIFIWHRAHLSSPDPKSKRRR